MSFLRPGKFFRIEGVQHRCDRLLGGGKYAVTNQRSFEPRVLTTEELIKLFESSKLDFLTDAEAAKTGYNPALVDYSQVTGKPRQAAERQAAYLRVVDRLGHERTRADMQLIIDQVAKDIGDPHPPHISTVYTWINNWIIGGRDIRACVPRTHKRGDRAKKLSSKIFQMISLVINDIYLKRPRKSVKTVHAHVKVAVEEHNKTQPLDRQLSPPSEATIRREIKKLDPYDVCVARYGKKAADNLFKTIGRGPVANRILERVGVDHTKLDILVTCGRTGVVLGRPTLSLAVDHFSRMIVGIYVGFEVPSALAVANCLRNAFLSKSYVKDLYPEVQNEWPCYGRWENAIFDNGADFHSATIESVLSSLGINVQFMPVRTPEYKGWVERLFRTLNDDLIHELDGTTGSNPEDRGDDKPEQRACIPLETLTLLIHMWAIDEYPYRKHSELNARPIDVWDRSAAENPPMPACRAMSDLDPLTAGIAYCTLSNRGIKLDGIKYNDPALQKLVMQAGKRPKKHEVRYDPSNLNEILVLDPVTFQYVRVPSLNPEYTEGLTQWQHKTFKKICAAKFDSVDMAKLARVRVMYTKIVEEAKHDARRLRRIFGGRYARFLKEGVKPIGHVSHLSNSTNHTPALPARPDSEMRDGFGMAHREAPVAAQSPATFEGDSVDASNSSFNTQVKVTFDD